MRDFVCVIPFVNNLEKLEAAVSSVRDDFCPNLFVLDNSEDCRVSMFGACTIRPTVPLSASQSINFLLKLAMESSASVALFMHSDAVAGPGVGRALLDRAADELRKKTNWGVIFTNYDALAAFNVQACRHIGWWDTTLPQYFSDNDYYRRMRLAGYQTLHAQLDVKHDASVTIKSDPKLQHLNSVTFPLYMRYYAEKWGGEPEQEKFIKPFNL